MATSKQPILLQNYKEFDIPPDAFKSDTPDAKAVEMIKWYKNAFNTFANQFLSKMGGDASSRTTLVKDLKNYILKEYIHDVRPSAVKTKDKTVEKPKDSLAFLTTVSTSNANEHAYVSNILYSYGMEILEDSIKVEKEG